MAKEKGGGRIEKFKSRAKNSKINQKNPTSNNAERLEDVKKTSAPRGLHSRAGRTLKSNHLDKLPQKADFANSVKPFYFLSLRQAMPGRTLPSKSSSDAPPPVEMCVILSANPSC